MITQQQYQEFMEHYAWQLLQSPDYRIGQAFLNYFPDLSRQMTVEEQGTVFEMKLYYETNNERAKSLINQWVTSLD